jgi:hypothetical protein
MLNTHSTTSTAPSAYAQPHTHTHIHVHGLQATPWFKARAPAWCALTLCCGGWCTDWPWCTLWGWCGYCSRVPVMRVPSLG